MLTLRLEGPFRRWSKTVAAATFFRAIGPSIRNGPTGHEVAVYRAGCWHRTSCTGSLLVLTGPFVAVAIDAPTAVSLEDETIGQRFDLGQFQQVTIERGQVHVEHLGTVDDHVIAELDESTGHWRLPADARLWPSIVFAQPRRNADSASPPTTQG
jgi:hypothetical protein